MEQTILGGGYTCSVCGQYQRTSALCHHINEDIITNKTMKQTRQMKTKEEIEHLSEKEYPKDSDIDEFNAYKKGYIQCQEDMADKKYTEEDMFKLWTRDILYCDEQEIPHEKKLFKDFINSLQD